MVTVERRSTWGFPRRLSLVLIGSVALQAGTMIWWASSLEARVEQNTHELSLHSAGDLETVKALTDLSVRLARIEERINDIRARLPAHK